MTKSLVHQVITRARQLIDDEGSWIQVYAAVSADGTTVEPFDERAVRFCASGALLRAAFELTSNLAAATELRDAACRKLVPHACCAVHTIEDLNDTSIGHGTILYLFDEYLEPCSFTS
jgi:hypothetical protein